MKTLILTLLLFIPQYFSTNLSEFIGKDRKEFVKYCEELDYTPRYGVNHQKYFIRIEDENKYIFCIYTQNGIEAFKIYYDAKYYTKKAVFDVYMKDLYRVGKDTYINPDNPKILYNLSDSEEVGYLCLVIYKHGI